VKFVFKEFRAFGCTALGGSLERLVSRHVVSVWTHRIAIKDPWRAAR
jgi:hypothetical protein